MVWLGAALLGALFATQWVNGEDGSAEPAAAVSDRQAPAREAKEIRAVEDDAAQLELERLERRKFGAQAGDIFSPKSWIPPPPPMKPQPPSPPPLTIKYLGKVIEGEETRVFINQAERNYIVRVGENIDGQYRMDAVTDRAITFTYLPLDAKQMLPIDGGA